MLQKPRRQNPKPRTLLEVQGVVFLRFTSALLLTGACWWIWTRARLGSLQWWEALLFALLVLFVSPTELLAHKYGLHHLPRTITVWGYTIELPDTSSARHHRLHHRKQARVEWIFIPLMAALLVVFGLTGIGVLLSTFTSFPLVAAADICTFVFLRVLWEEEMHYLAHCSSYKPEVGTLWARYVVRVTTPHKRHHQRNEKFNWEVSTLWRWADWLYGLWQRYRGRLATPDIPLSHTTDTLGVEIDDEGYVIKQAA